MRRETKEANKRAFQRQVIAHLPKVCKGEIESQLRLQFMPNMDRINQVYDVYDVLISRAIRLAKINEIFDPRWKEGLEPELKKAWDAELEKARRNGTFPMTWNAACRKAWNEMERKSPFLTHEMVSMRGLRHWITNWICAYPFAIWRMWPDMPKDLEHLEDSIPSEIEEHLQVEFRKINRLQPIDPQQLDNLQLGHLQDDICEVLVDCETREIGSTEHPRLHTRQQIRELVKNHLDKTYDTDVRNIAPDPTQEEIDQALDALLYKDNVLIQHEDGRFYLAQDDIECQKIGNLIKETLKA